MHDDAKEYLDFRSRNFDKNRGIQHDNFSEALKKAHAKTKDEEKSEN